jgi:bisphosphoglycerate-dependent phosphoglycerate mutase
MRKRSMRLDPVPGASTILLVRHAESEANAAHNALEGDTDSPLSERGVVQAAADPYQCPEQSGEPVTDLIVRAQ